MNNERQELAKSLSYKERYRNYKAWFAERETKRLSLKPWQYTTHIKPWSYSLWLKQSSTSSIPADCRAGQGKEEWQS